MVSIWVGDHTVEGLNVDAVIQYCTIPEAEKQGLLYIVQYTHTNCCVFVPLLSEEWYSVVHRKDGVMVNRKTEI